MWRVARGLVGIPSSQWRLRVEVGWRVPGPDAASERYQSRLL